MRKAQLFAVLAVLAVVVSGCYGKLHYLSSRDMEPFAIGEATREKVVEVFGEPTMLGTTFFDSKKIETLVYGYLSPDQSSAYDRGHMPIKAFVFQFSDGILIGRQFSSSFKIGNSYFDQEKCSLIKTGVSKVEHVKDILGAPHGEYSMVYNGKKLDGVGFMYSKMERSASENVVGSFKHVVFFYDENEVVQYVHSLSNEFKRDKPTHQVVLSVLLGLPVGSSPANEVFLLLLKSSGSPAIPLPTVSAPD